MKHIDQQIISASIVRKAAAISELKERPRIVEGKTYKIKPPIGSNAAMYITINDITLEGGRRWPIEVFINTKDATHQQWIVGLTRMISAVFRSSTNIDFVFEELQQVFDPLGGYFDGGQRINSVVAHIGSVLHEHVHGHPTPQPNTEGALLCPKCQTYSARMLDGCLTCTGCGYSHCG